MSRKLAQLAAERVMGVKPRDIRLSASTEYVRIWDDNPFYQDGICTKYDLGLAGPPDYPGDIAAAWKLVDHLGHAGWEWEVKPGVCVQFWMGRELRLKRLEGQDCFAAGPEYAPLAITIAALRACGVTEAEIEEARGDA